jgi:hypothetical protein
MIRGVGQLFRLVCGLGGSFSRYETIKLIIPNIYIVHTDCRER